MAPFERLTPEESRLYAGRVRLWGSACVVFAGALLLGLAAFSPNRPRDYAGDADQFFYGSIGSDISAGLPVAVLQVLPRVFPDYLPPGAARHDYTAFGFIQQAGHPLPIGFSVRRQVVDLASINCAACHTGSVRVSEHAPALVIPGMPANTVDLLAYYRFLFRAAADDDRFNADTLVAAMRQAGLIGALETPIYRLAIPMMKDGLLSLERRLSFVQDPGYTPFGPGRVDTFDTFKFNQFHYFYKEHGQPIGPEETFGIVDFPSIWNQAARDGLRLHWDGNNSSLHERNLSASLGAGAQPQDVDLRRLQRIEDYLRHLPAPRWPFPVDAAKAARGKLVYERYCADCHELGGSRMGQVIPLDSIGTDRSRLDSYTQFLLRAQQDYTSHVPWTFSHFTKTDGYANQPLDGIWARAPYLHNGSVPSMWDLLTPESARPRDFTVGDDVYDPATMGFRHQVVNDPASYTGPWPVRNTTLRGNGNRGHSGAPFGTELSADDKWALIEYLKTK